MLSGKGELKQQNTTTHLVERTKSRTLKASNTGGESQEPSFVAGGNANGTLILEDN